MAPPEEKARKKKRQQSTDKDDSKKKMNNKKRQKLPKHHQEVEMVNNESLKPEKERIKMNKKEKKKKATDGDIEVVVGEKVHNTTARNNRSVVTDPRFESVHYDPKFQRVPKHRSKVTIDSRFDSMFKEKSFVGSSAPVDKRGKHRKGKLENPLLHYYIHQNETSKVEKGVQLRDFEPRVSDDDEEDVVRSVNDSSTDTSSNDGEDDDDDQFSIKSDVAHYLMADHDDTPRIEQPTHRLAAVNMDWDHIKAVDIYVTMTSSVPKDGHVLSVAVYPSQFGLECMDIEATHGPSRLIYGAVENNDSDEESEEGHDDATENETLRTYELSRLRYYYAVVVCDSSTTANHLYKNLDGTELLKTSNVFDMRFIPDSMEFSHPPRDIITEAPASYNPPDFQTRALQHSSVKLSWDAEEPERKKILKRKFNVEQLEDLDSDSLIASDEEESGEEDLSNDHPCKADKEKYLALLQSSDHSDDEDDDGKQDMEITFNTGLEDIAKRIHEKKENNSITVWQAYLRKLKEKKKSRKKNDKYSSKDDESESDYEAAPLGPDQPDDFFAEETLESDVKAYKDRKRSQDRNKEQEASLAELELLCANGGRVESPIAGDDDMMPEKVKGKKGKKLLNEQKLPKEDYKEDPRFAGLLNSHLFAMDPTDPQFKRSATYSRQVIQKQKHRYTSVQEQSHQPPDEPPMNKVGEQNSDEISSKNENQEYKSLLRSLKGKTKVFKMKKES